MRDMTWTFQRVAAFMNMCWLAAMVGTFVPDRGTPLQELFYLVLVVMQFTVPPISIAALLAKPAQSDSRN